MTYILAVLNGITGIWVIWMGIDFCRDTRAYSGGKLAGITWIILGLIIAFNAMRLWP